MRLTIGLILALLSLTAYRLLAPAPAAPVPPRQGRPAPPPPQPVPSQVMYQQDFEGYGETVEDAQRHALEQAREWIVEQVPLGWAPQQGDELLQRGLIAFDTPVQIELEHSGSMKVVKAHLTIRKTQAEEILQKVRQKRSAERSTVVARVLSGLVALLLVAGGYLRLEEATRGYYTTVLRTAAVGLLLLVLLGVLVIG